MATNKDQRQAFAEVGTFMLDTLRSGSRRYSQGVLIDYTRGNYDLDTLKADYGLTDLEVDNILHTAANWAVEHINAHGGR